VLEVGQRSLSDKIITAVYLLSATVKVIHIAASQLNNKSNVKDGKSNKIINISL
jgi:hypothetical protein